MGIHDFKYNNVPLFARKPGNINTSMSAAPKLALVPASRYYCDVSKRKAMNRNWGNQKANPALKTKVGNK